MISAFWKLNIVQFLAAINENVFKLLCAYFLISLFGEGKSSQIMAIVGALFILPFLLFSSIGGILADKLPKNRVTCATRFGELICLIGATFLFMLKEPWSPYLILFIMATLAALFGPSKYGIIPELIPKEKLLSGNGIIASFTFLGIIIGTTLASLLLWITKKQYTLALLTTVGIAVVGWIISLYLPKTPIENEEKSIRFFIYGELWDGLKQMWNIKKLFFAFFAYSYFLYIGAFMQLNIIPYTVELLHFEDIYGGYFFLISSIGLGIGSFVTSRISHGSLSLVPLAGTGISLIMIFLFFFLQPWWLIILWMLVLGFLGGVFLIPSQTYLMAESPEKDRGRNFATTNFFSFTFALFASLTIYILNTLLGCLPDMSFLIVGLFNLLVMFGLFKAVR